MGRKNETLLSAVLRTPGASCTFVIVLLLVVMSVSFLGSYIGVVLAIEGDATWQDIHSKLLKIPAMRAKAAESGKKAPLDYDVPALIEEVEDADGSINEDVPPHPAKKGPRQSYDVDSRTSGYWRELTEICRDADRVWRSCRDVDRSGWTDGAKSTFTPLEFAGLGAWSTFKIISHTSNGAVKTKGGDSWVMLLLEEEQALRVPTRIFDNGDGTYTVAVWFHLPGRYKIHAWLYYSDCHGVDEPKEDVDTIIQDHPYFDRINKEDQCYIGQRVYDPPGAEIEVPQDAKPPECLARKCQAAAAAKNPDIKARTFGDTWRTDTYYMHKDGALVSLPCCKKRLSVRKAKDPPPKRLLFCGDSTVYYPWIVLVQATRAPCKVKFENQWASLNLEAMSGDWCEPLAPGASLAEMDPEFPGIYERCTGGVPWTTVPIGADTEGSARNSPFPLYFDMERFQYDNQFAVNHNPPVQLPLPREFSFVFLESGSLRTMLGLKETLKWVQEGDVLVINVGHHYTRLMRFDAWVEFVDELAAYLKELKEQTGALMVLRTSFFLKENAVRSFNLTKYPQEQGPMLVNQWVPVAIFNTEARRILFDSYAEHALSKVGVHVWDVYGLTAPSVYRRGDMFHAAGASTWAQNNDMMDLFGCKN